MPGLAQLAQRLLLTQRLLQRSQLRVGLGRVGDLRLQQVRSVTAEAVQLDHEAADVAELDLPQLRRYRARRRTRLRPRKWGSGAERSAGAAAPLIGDDGLGLMPRTGSGSASDASSASSSSNSAASSSSNSAASVPVLELGGVVLPELGPIVVVLELGFVVLELFENEHSMLHGWGLVLDRRGFAEILQRRLGLWNLNRLRLGLRNLNRIQLGPRDLGCACRAVDMRHRQLGRMAVQVRDVVRRRVAVLRRGTKSAARRRAAAADDSF